MESLGRYKDKLIECKEQQYMVVWGFFNSVYFIPFAQIYRENKELKS